MTGRLILVRHGQTVANVAKKLDTRPPGAPLTELGEQQASALAERFRGSAPALLAASEALRARQTAQPVSQATGAGLQVLSGLHEVQVGDLEGRSDDAAHEQFVEVFRRWYEHDLDARLPGGESGHDALGRYLPVLDALRAEHLGGGACGGGDGSAAADGFGDRDVVVVSHGAIIRLAVNAMSDVDPEFAEVNHLSNTDAVVLAPYADGGWHLERWGDETPPFTVEKPEGTDDPMG